ncbi:glutamate 5-kinase [Fructilactobacillus frigidiflavus]|uniref:glutamate 5-kinase n=1 Tax=Fructilactobacillus frigidiflavus TaxID=3242688 RepID=UPI003757DFFA
MNVQKPRIVVKIGTSSLVNDNGSLKVPTINRLARTLSDLNQAGYAMILVSSGAVGAGMSKLQIKQRPTDIAELQALSAVGQVALMELYTRAFNANNQEIAQILLTRDVVDFPISHHNVLRTINQLVAQQVIPIINENDPVSVDEFHHQTTFGENDQLAAIVTKFIDADELIIMSDINGLYDANPTTHPDAKLLRIISQIDDKIMKFAGGNGSQFGSGGMATKLKAAQIILDSQKKMVIVNGKNPEIIKDVLNGDFIGTTFSK